ncbi:MAG: PAS domain S-box protein [Acidobacteriaceae bacterium]|nr:PAS domain S-box protein [Acidobacteriaceae bacterium]
MNRRATTTSVLRNKPIRQKLVFIAMATTAIALLVAGFSIVVADSLLFRLYLDRDLSALAKIVADNSTGALAFGDTDAADQILGALRARPHLAAACLYRTDGTLFARYLRDASSLCPVAVPREEITRTGKQITFTEPVMLKGAPIGTLMFSYDFVVISERVRFYGAIVIGVLLGASLLAYLLASRLRSLIETPISRLLLATTAVSKTGDYTIRAQKLTGDELGVLVERFNEMLEGIQRREGDLRAALVARDVALLEVRQERERFRFLAESMPQKIFTANQRGEVDYFNHQWFEFTGLPFSEIKDWGWTQFIHPDDLQGNVDSWKRSIETGEPFIFEHRFRRADGRYRWHLSRAHAMRNANGEITMWIGSNTDIHEQKEKEEALRRANEDLEQFAYSASHDLQEPIRNVSIYSEIVARRYHSVLDADGQQFLQFIREGGRRLSTLVQDLLAYTRASMADLTETPVESSAVLHKSLANLSEAIRETDAKITCDPLPRVYMGEAHLEQLFQNLISNALKYRSAERPHVHITAASRGALWCFSVQDNGIGIDPRYKDRIFGVFKRLHHDRDYTGTGIGLAICQRVVERYGGRIWVESQPGRGAIFFFTVPRFASSNRPEAVESVAG